MGHRVSCFTLTPVWGEPPHYQLLIENPDLPVDEVTDRLAAMTDQKLRELNCEYDEKRESGRLGSIRIVRLQAGTWQRFAVQRQSRFGGSVEQFKHPCLIPDMEVVARSFGDRFIS